MKGRTKLSIGLLAFAVCVCWVPKASLAAPQRWKLGMQAYSFKEFTFSEAVDKNKALGMDYIECYPGQTLSKEKTDVKVNHNMSSEDRKAMKRMLRKASVTLINYGVVGLPNDEAESRKVFEFAKEMGIKTIVSEPPEDAFDLIDKLCKQYRIKVALHNHPKPSHYWDPDTVLRLCEGRSKWIGACADTGHWTRSGVDPLEAIKKLGAAKRIISLHFKDLNEFGNPKAHDVPWGTGVSQAGAILAELDRQNFRGSFSIEYEHNWLNSMPEIKKCVAFFRKTEAELRDVEYEDLFRKNLSNALKGSKDWAFGADGVLAPTPTGHGDIWTKESYGNFILELDFKVPERGNSGVFIRGSDPLGDWINTTIEIQIHATTDGSKHGQCGAVFDCLPPSKDATKKPGEWNHYVITCLDNKIYVNLNGEDIIDMDLDFWTEPRKNPGPPVAAGTRNKFKYAYKDMAREGRIGFQYHGNPVWFKNLKIKSLD
ncbi:MAG: family 16 glycoside hydrolase [Planctomycetota bacterium]|jgi:sugar phosphate isomerase/epimerase